MSDDYFCDRALVGGTVETSVRVTVDAGRFIAVAVGAARAPSDRHLPGITLPGFANAHSHAFHRALRSRTQRDRGSFWTWRDVMYRVAERLDPDRYHALARAVFAEMALAGFTAVGEFHYVHHQPGGTAYADPNAMGEALFAAAREAGVRLLLLDTLYLHGGLDRGGYAEPGAAQRRFADASVEAWAERTSQIRADGDRELIGAAVHSVRSVDPEAMALVGAWADERQAPLHAHVSEQTDENTACHDRFAITPLALLQRAGTVTDRFTAVHATHLTDHDIALLADAGSTVCMCPTTERDLGDGIGPTDRLADAGVPLSIGSDSHAVIDPFEETRAIELDERLRSMRRGVHRADELIHAATVAGHASLGWQDAGRIEVGGRADLVTVALDSVRTAGAGPDAPLEAVVFAATSSDVTHVVIDGRTVVVDGAHVDIDVPRELDESIRALMGD